MYNVHKHSLKTILGLTLMLREKNGSTISGWAPLNRAQLKLDLKKFEAVLSSNSKGM